MIKQFVSAVDNTIFRKDKIVELCRGQDVLHLGFVQHAHLYKQKIKEGDWLHSQIADVAKRVVGIDYLSTEVEEIKEMLGYEAYIGDVMRLRELTVKDTFDVVVCGELIEHLENPGLMLDGIKQFIHSGALVILTTPNPWSAQRINLIRKGILEEKWLNSEHAVWFSFQTLKQIVERAEYVPILCDYYYGQSRREFLKGTEKGLLGKIRLLKRIMQLTQTPKHQYDGLFFIVTIR